MRALPLAFAASAALALACGCRREAPATPARAPAGNVLLVTIDTLRADHVGCYGHATAATPVLDGLAARGVRFATAVVHVPLTGPSHASILTGLNPPGHGLRDNGGFVLPAEVRSGVEDFRQAGYRTAAFVSAFPLDRRFGLDRGFETYDDHLPRGNDRRRTPYVERFADATTDAVLRWLATPAASPGPFFLWVHYYDPHAPYEPPGELASRYRAAPYDGEVAFVDQQLGRLLRALEEKGVLARTLVVAMSDHGEGLGEHGEGTHGLFVYDATLKVPFIVAGPGVPSGRVATTVARGIDVLPTLLDWSGLVVRKEIEGRSLRPALEGREMSDAPAYAETLYPEREFGWAPLFAWRTATRKAIEAPRPELYDLERDPGETQNRAGAEGAQLAGMQQRIQAALQRPTPAAAAVADPEAAERLRALGYVGGGAAPAPGGGPRRDPKDGVRLMPRVNRAMQYARTDPGQSIRDLQGVLAEDPGLLIARRTLAVAYAAAGQHDRAIAELRRLEKDGQLTAEDAIVLGDNLRFAGKLDESAAVLETVARENPRWAQPLLSLAETHVKAQRNGQAAATYRRALEIAPDQVEALRGLGDLALLQGDAEGAGRQYERVLEVEPRDAGAMSKLGVVRMRSGRGDEAIGLFRRAIEAEPENAEALLYLAGALASSGRPAEAVPYFERSLRADPGSTMAWNGLALTRLGLGDRAGAAKAFKESLRLDSDQPDVVRALAGLGRSG